MTGEHGFWNVVGEIRRREPGFSPEAYGFLMEVLEYTITELGERRHITALELLRGLCGRAKQRFGMLAFLILERWGIRESRDVGAIVFQLVDAGVLSRRDSDSVEDFNDTIDLRRELEESYFEENPGPNRGAN